MIAFLIALLAAGGGAWYGWQHSTATPTEPGPGCEASCPGDASEASGGSAPTILTLTTPAGGAGPGG